MLIININKQFIRKRDNMPDVLFSLLFKIPWFISQVSRNKSIIKNKDPEYSPIYLSPICVK